MADSVACVFMCCRCPLQVDVKSCATAFINCTCVGKPELGENCTYADPAFDA
jgi:hypothetical protein